MSLQAGLLLVGLSHKSASVELRERCALSNEDLAERLGELRAIDGVDEAFMLSTCNRTEALVAGSPEALAGEGVEAAVRSAVFRAVPGDVLYAFRGVEAVMHVFRLVAGLDSLILGESQILGQVKDAFRAARASRTCGRLLEPLLQQALRAGKRVRSETAVGSGTLSVARAGVSIAERVVGSFEETAALVVGAGDTARLVARHLRDQRIKGLTFVNRTPARAHEAAQAFGGLAAGLDQLPKLVPEADVVVVCVEGAASLLSPANVDTKRLSRRDRPLVLVDLSVPRAVHPDLAANHHVLCYHLDDIAEIVDSNHRARERAGEEAAPILVAEVHKFLALRTYASFKPTITRMRERFQRVREGELDVIAGPHATPEMIELAHKLTSHLLDVAFDELKTNARSRIAHESLDRAYQRFLRER